MKDDFVYDLLCQQEGANKSGNPKGYEMALNCFNYPNVVPLHAEGWRCYAGRERQPSEARCRLYLNLANCEAATLIAYWAYKTQFPLPGFHSIKFPANWEHFLSRPDNCVMYFCSFETCRLASQELAQMKRLKTVAILPALVEELKDTDSLSAPGKALALGFAEQPCMAVDFVQSRPYHPRVEYKPANSFSRLRAQLIYLAIRHAHQLAVSDHKEGPPIGPQCGPKHEETFYLLVRLYFKKCEIPLNQPWLGGRKVAFGRIDGQPDPN